MDKIHTMMRDRVIDFLVQNFPNYIAQGDELLEGVTYLVLTEVTRAAREQCQRLLAQYACPR